MGISVIAHTNSTNATIINRNHSSVLVDKSLVFEVVLVVQANIFQLINQSVIP